MHHKTDACIAGNFYNKYTSQNPLVKLLISRFQSSLDKLLAKTNAHDIHEIGCGEGYLCIPLAKTKRTIRGSDISSRIIDVAQKHAAEENVSISFQTIDIYDLDPDKDAAGLIICCEVLEHLPDPHKALELLSRLAKPYAIISVPQEPLWSYLNMLRGKYWAQGGNTPGHIQRWSKESFITIAGKYFDIEETCSPLPWTMLLCRSKKSK